MVMLAFVVVSCDDGARPPPAEVPQPTVTPVGHVQFYHGGCSQNVDYGTYSGQSLKLMVAEWPEVFVGEVTGAGTRMFRTIPEPLYSQAVAEGLSWPDAAMTVFRLDIERPYAGTVESDVTIAVRGYDQILPDGSTSRIEDPNEPLLHVGSQYLVFARLDTEGESSLSVAPWGRYEINDDELQPVTHCFDSLPLVQQLTGMTLDDFEDLFSTLDASSSRSKASD
jgi:hypothetical protein